MNNNIYTTNSSRESEKVKNLLSSDEPKAGKVILNCSSDVGVMRNLGRNGAKLAPRAIIAQLSNMQKHTNEKILIKEISNINEQNNDFATSQLKQSERALPFITRELINLGGGHDHVFPLLSAIEKKFSKIIVLNIDAHCDTRKSDHSHSGTPFRQFMETTKSDFTLYQYGIHHFANSESTLNVGKSKMSIASYDQAREQSANFTTLPNNLLDNILKQLSDDCFFLLSLDADAIDSSLMEGVSAPNHHGLPAEHVRDIFKWYKGLQNPKAAGIYEYNPAYDPSTKGARFLASLIYDLLF